MNDNNINKNEKFKNNFISNISIKNFVIQTIKIISDGNCLYICLSIFLLGESNVNIIELF